MNRTANRIISYYLLNLIIFHKLRQLLTVQYLFNCLLEEQQQESAKSVVSDQNGSTIAQTFDDINRLTRKDITKGTGVIGVTYETFDYDGLSRMTSAANDYSNVNMGYDTLSRLLTEQQQIGGQSVKSVVSTFDKVGNRLSLTYPSGKVVNIIPDELDRIKQIKDASANIIAQYSYAGPFRVTNRDYLNGVGLSVTYDGNKRITGYQHQKSGSTIAGFNYAYDKEANKLYEQRVHEGGKGDCYTYDSIYRLITAKIGVVDPVAEIQNPGSQTYDKKIGYNLDGVGNREDVITTPWSQPPITVDYTPNNLNQYEQVDSTPYTYDNNGNLKDDGTYLYFYDYANRLMEVKRKSDSVVIATFKYDALGRRIQKTHNPSLTTHNYYLDGARVIEERNGSDAVLATYTFGNGIDEVLKMERGGQNYYYHENTLGSIYAVTDGSGNIVEKYEYDPYGKVTIKDASGVILQTSGIGNCYMFTGRRYDSETGLYYYRARYYSPELGRFLQRDPLGYEAGINLYEYARNNPINYIDPFGLGEKEEAELLAVVLPPQVVQGPIHFIEKMDRIYGLEVVFVVLKELGKKVRKKCLKAKVAYNEALAVAEKWWGEVGKKALEALKKGLEGSGLDGEARAAILSRGMLEDIRRLDLGLIPFQR